MHDWKKFFVGDEWGKLYKAASTICSKRSISPTVSAGGIAAAILASNGKIYTGVCIDMACSLGMCAERAAIAAMIADGQSIIKRLVCVDLTGKCRLPCGACLELLMQLGGSSAECEVMVDYSTRATIKLKELLPRKLSDIMKADKKM